MSLECELHQKSAFLVFHWLPYPYSLEKYLAHRLRSMCVFTELIWGRRGGKNRRIWEWVFKRKAAPLQNQVKTSGLNSGSIQELCLTHLRRWYEFLERGRGIDNQSAFFIHSLKCGFDDSALLGEKSVTKSVILKNLVSEIQGFISNNSDPVIRGITARWNLKSVFDQE